MRKDEINCFNRPDIESLVESYEKCKELDLHNDNSIFYWVERKMLPSNEINVILMTKDKLHCDGVTHGYGTKWVFENIYPAPLKND